MLKNIQSAVSQTALLVARLAQQLPACPSLASLPATRSLLPWHQPSVALMVVSAAGSDPTKQPTGWEKGEKEKKKKKRASQSFLADDVLCNSRNSFTISSEGTAGRAEVNASQQSPML